MTAFSPTLLDHFWTPRNQGQLSDPSGEGYGGSLRTGQVIHLQVQIQEDRILSARFQAYGCAPAIACSSYLTEWVTGRTLQEAATFTPAQLEKALGGLPPRRRFCAAMAVEALQRALEDAARRSP